MIAPFNIRIHEQGEGAPIFDPCTTVRAGEDEHGDWVRVIYTGWSFCPLGRFGIHTALAVTRKSRVVVERWDTPEAQVDEGEIT